MNGFWQGFGSKLADQWVATVLTPAFVFWGGGFIAWITHFGLSELNPLGTHFNQLPPILQVTLLIGCLLGITISSIIIQLLDLTILRLLEGYWPHQLAWLSHRGVGLQSKSLDAAEERYQELLNQKQDELSPEEEKELVSLDQKLRLAPSMDRMPTKLGNILRAAENRPNEKYGLTTSVCWSRLWLLMPESVKNELTGARANLDTAVRIFLWSILFLVWIVWAWWALIVMVLGAFWSYRWALSAAMIYGDLLESAFDLHRFALYDALGWPLPQSTKDEKSQGIKLTEYLFRGLVDKPVIYKTFDRKK